MRKNQISIKVERFGDQVPKDVASTHQIISVYADSNNFADALFEALHLLMEEVNGNDDASDVAGYSAVDNVTGVLQCGEDMDKISRKVKSDYHEVSRELEHAKLELSAMENAVEICRMAALSEDEGDLCQKMSERFGLDKWDVSRWLSIDFIHVTKADIEEKKKEILELQDRFDVLKSQSNAFDEC